VSIQERAAELAEFFHMPEPVALAKLSLGFLPLHAAVTEDFRARQGTVPFTEYELLEWYRTTEAYIWELSAYHEDPGFNYQGMCDGIAHRLKHEPGCLRVLCLGDGIGDLTLTLRRAGFMACYHDLAESRTAEYAAFRFARFGEYSFDDCFLSGSFAAPVILEEFHGKDAVISLDFLEHVPNVEDWVRAIHAALKPGGLFMAQNAFNCGSGPQGAMPMHLAVNDRFEKDWDPLLAAVGFEQLGPNWYRKA
jgi:SAM-dependent methyltransferase